MARRKNTADCKDVLGKIFETGAAGQPRGQTYSGETAGAARHSEKTGIGGQSRSPAELQASPLLRQPQGDHSEVLNRHGGIRSSAPDVPGSGSPSHSVPCGEPAGPESHEIDAGAVNAIEVRDSGPEAGDPFSPGGEADGFADGAPGPGEEAAAEEAGFDGGNDDIGAGESDPVASRMSGDRSFSYGEDDDPSSGLVTDDELADEIITQALSGDSATGQPRLRSRVLGWLLRDDSLGVFGQSVQVRASTVVLVGLTAAIFAGLLGLYFSIDRTEGNLAERILDERQGLSGPAATGSDERGSKVSPAGGRPRLSANLPARKLGPGGIPVPARPLWSRRGAAPAPGIPRPPVRNVQGAAAFVTTPATRWLRVRDLMGKEECAKLLDHLKRLQQHLEERSGCADGAIACKQLKSRIKERHGEELYAVDIGPFASWNFAQAASAALKEVTRSTPWVFRGKADYFAESYPRKP
jgi:hypothetical protein